MASQAEGRYWKSGWAWWHQQTHRDRVHWFSKGWRCKVKKNWNVDPKLRSSQENRQSKTAEDGVDSGFGAAAEVALYWDSLWNKEPPESQLLITTKVFLARETSSLTLLPVQSSSPLCSAWWDPDFCIGILKSWLKVHVAGEMGQRELGERVERKQGNASAQSNVCHFGS